MKQEIALDLLQTMTEGYYSTTELVEASGYSPTTVNRYIQELTDQGLVERQKTERLHPGRPAIINFPTSLGLEILQRGTSATFRKLTRRSDTVWGPRQSFTYWGVSFYGKPDVFAKSGLPTSLFEIVVEPRTWLYDRPVTVEGDRYPALEPFLAWAAGSTNPRYLAACAALLRSAEVDVEALRSAAKTAGTVNRLGYLAEIAEATDVLMRLEPRDEEETMLDQDAPPDQKSAWAARRWNVKNPLSTTPVVQMVQLYGDS